MNAASVCVREREMSDFDFWHREREVRFLTEFDVCPFFFTIKFAQVFLSTSASLLSFLFCSVFVCLFILLGTVFFFQSSAPYHLLLFFSYLRMALWGWQDKIPATGPIKLLFWTIITSISDAIAVVFVVISLLFATIKPKSDWRRIINLYIITFSMRTGPQNSYVETVHLQSQWPKVEQQLNKLVLCERLFDQRLVLDVRLILPARLL